MSYDYIKLVDFKTWCPKCKYYKTKESEDPCNECLEHGANEATTRPVRYEENKNRR